MASIRVLLVGDRTMERLAMESRLSIDARVCVEMVSDACSAATLVEWRHYSLLVVNVTGLGRSLVDLINTFSEHSRESRIAFFGGRSTAMVKAAELIAQARGLALLKVPGLDQPGDGSREYRRFVGEHVCGVPAGPVHEDCLEPPIMAQPPASRLR
ncbi:hypothetical protein [Stenotrophomonas maltophilia]|jgi:hypothetical protein|uniref:Uncharacterized protein n=2 Tax=Lysobacteraceae TaxID=32033 RepID=A0A2J0U9H4_STEMA|nr:hypothetical protein B9Y64_15735 [Stenotrophomonas maltophilia]